MDLETIIKALHGLFILTGLFAWLNAWAGKWGPSFAMLGLSLAAFSVGLALSDSYLAVVPALFIVVIVGAFRYGRRSKASQNVASHEADKAISDGMLAEMNRNVAARKARRG